jgi:hypothetical protein
MHYACSEQSSSLFAIFKLGGVLVYVQGVPKKKEDMESGIFGYISQLSSDFQQINFMACTNLVHCGYFEHKTFSENEF